MRNLLKREVRFDKNGVAVHRNVIADAPETRSNFSKPAPTVGSGQQVEAQRENIALVSSLSGDLASEERAQIAKEEATINAEQDPAKAELLREEADDRKFNARNFTGRVNALGDYSSDTLKMLDEAFSGSGKLTGFMMNADYDDEEFIKSAITFRDSGLFNSPDSLQILRDVRWSTGSEPLYDILEDSEEHAAVSATIDVAVGLRERSDDPEGLSMSPGVAGVIADHQGRVSDIVEYIGSRELDPRDVNCDDLRRHLES